MVLQEARARIRCVEHGATMIWCGAVSWAFCTSLTQAWCWAVPRELVSMGNGCNAVLDASKTVRSEWRQGVSGGDLGGRKRWSHVHSASERLLGEVAHMLGTHSSDPHSTPQITLLAG